MDVDQAVCYERQKVIDERFARDKHDIQALQVHQEDAERRTAEIEKLNVQMAEILKKHEAQIDDHEKRITSVESRDGKKWGKVTDCIISGVVAALVAALMAIVLNGGIA